MQSSTVVTARIPSLTLPLRLIRPAPRSLAVLALVAANAIWGGSVVATKAVQDHLPPVTTACLRIAIALVVLLPLVARGGSRPARGGATALLGLTGVALFCLFHNLALGSASAATTALITGGIPVLTALLATAILGERLGQRRLAGLLLSGVGVVAIVFMGTGATLRTSLLGALLPLAAALSFASYVVLGRQIFSSGNALAVVAGSTRYGLFFLMPGAVLELSTTGIRSPSLGDILLLLYLGAGCSALAFVLCGYGLAHLDAGQGAAFGNLKPLVGVLLAVVFLGESLSPGHLVGGALVLLGVPLAVAQPYRRRGG